MCFPEAEVPVGRGFRRARGRPGIRNKVLILYTVECSRHVCQEITRRFEYTGRVDCVGNEGCTKNEVVLRQLKALAAHPNTGAVLAVGMGCEELTPDCVLESAAAAGRPCRSFSVQEAGGTEKSIARGVQMVSELLGLLPEVPDTELFWKDLCVGAECGCSDYTSLLTANPLVGAFMDALTAAGGAGVIGELNETVGLRKALLARAADGIAARAIDEAYSRMLYFCKSAGRFSISPGNFSGGLSTIEEKSVGALAKSGSSPIQGVLKLGQTVPAKGLWLVDEHPDPGSFSDLYRGGDASSMMSLVTAGCQLLFLTTGRGHVAGVPVCPVLKITGNEETFSRMAGDTDFDASGLLTKGESREAALHRLCELSRQVISGKQSLAEKHRVSCVTLPFNCQSAAGVPAASFCPEGSACL